jgi:UDP-N-acetylglucosamine diphosphorylase/glucosamine-1-phosphate N-acetyltransferase
MRVCLFEDRNALDLEPLTLTRPAFDLLCGLSSLAAKQCRYFDAGSVGALVRPHLAGVVREAHPGAAVNDAVWMRAGPAVLVNGRWLPPPGAAAELERPGVGLLGGEVAYAVVPPDRLARCAADTLEDCLASFAETLPRRPAGGRLFRRLWELVEHNGEQIAHDWEAARPASSEVPAGAALVGPAERLVIDPGARVEPFVLVDTSGGPVVVDRDAVVTAFTRLEGPCYVGPGTQLHGARVRAGTSFGPQCRVGGEVEASVVQGYSNKYHEGFLGHAYVGEWVNLGAGTHNSDLRNDYGPVSVTVGGRRVETGRTKVGCFLGDHAKTGLGTLLNTGTNAGVFCNLLPGALLPKYVPSFASWWNGALEDRADPSQLLLTAGEVMRRRGREMTEAHATLYRTLFEETAPERRRAVREARLRELRRTA